MVRAGCTAGAGCGEAPPDVSLVDRPAHPAKSRRGMNAAGDAYRGSIPPIYPFVRFVARRPTYFFRTTSKTTVVVSPSRISAVLASGAS